MKKYNFILSKFSQFILPDLYIIRKLGLFPVAHFSVKIEDNIKIYQPNNLNKSNNSSINIMSLLKKIKKNKNVYISNLKKQAFNYFFKKENGEDRSIILAALLLITISFLNVTQSIAQCHIEDWSALKALYESTDGDNWMNNEGWELVKEAAPSPECDLEVLKQLELDDNGRVVYLDLSNNYLRGSIPSEFWNLTKLRYLNLKSNITLGGRISPEIEKLSDLTTLWLSKNSFYGSIPPEIGNLTKLTDLRLAENHNISGNIPPEIENLTKLTTLWLQINKLDGSIPPELGNLKNLTDLRLNWNWLTGNIPPELGNLTKLTELHLRDNDLSGGIPPELGNLVNLTSLDLPHIYGSIPPELGNLTNLTSLNLTNISGSIPPELGNLANLTSLNLSNISGSIPPELGNLANLTNLRLLGQLSGGIPPELGNLTNLISLNLSGNQLSGSIPPELGNLAKLTELYLSNNCLSGCFNENLAVLCDQLNDHSMNANNFETPWETFCALGIAACENSCKLSDWTALKAFYQSANGTYWKDDTGWDIIKDDNPPPDCNLGNMKGINLDINGRVNEISFFSNELSGSIASELGNLTNLTKLWLPHNQLSGSIPPELGNLTNLTDLDMGANQLNGNIPPELGNLVNLVYLDLGANQLSGSIPPESSNLTNLTYLNLGANQFSGNIPPELGNLVNLTYLNLGSNQLSGCFDDNLSKLCNQLSVSNISIGNNFKASWERFCSTGTMACENSCHVTDWETLKTFYQNTNGDNWYDNTNWDVVKAGNPPAHCNLDNLYGVSLNEKGRVHLLINNNNNLKGEILPELCNLTNLAELSLSSNQLSGSIPAEFSKLTNLIDLNLGANQLSGTIPSGFGKLTNLIDLDLRSNQLSGSIPLELSYLTNLTYLNLESNQLSGCFDNSLSKLCDQLKRWSSISTGNNFEASWERFCSTGTLACENSCHITDWEALKALYKSTNGDNWNDNTNWDVVKADSPPDNCNLDNLYGVSLNEKGRVYQLINHHNNLKGEIPPELGNLTDLIELNLGANQLSGSIPLELGNLTNLTELVLWLNQLSGSIPAELGNLTNLTELGLSSNSLNGSIPPELSNLPNLAKLWLGKNQLSGTIPNFNQKFLYHLDLYNNFFDCADISRNFEHYELKPIFRYSPQFFTPLNYKNIQSTVIDSLSFNQPFTLSLELPWAPGEDFTYTWRHHSTGTTFPTNSATYTIDNFQPANAGKYTLEISSMNCLPDDNPFVMISEPIYVIAKGYDLYGQAVEYDQIMVEFNNLEDIKKYENEILTVNAGWVKESCNCNRELYLWEFPTTEAAVVALLEIDQKSKRIKRKTKPKGGFNNSFSLREAINTPKAYNIVSEAFNNNFPEEVSIFFLDSGLDEQNYEVTPYLYKQAPVDSCYNIDSHSGYSYIDSTNFPVPVSTNYLDEIGHGTFGLRSITSHLEGESNLKLVPLKIFNKNGEGTLFDMVCALYHAIDHNADIINISAGYQGEPSDILENAINLAREKDIFITTATGNDTLNIDSLPQYPAYYAGQYHLHEFIDERGEEKYDTVYYDNVISVASINVNGQLSEFSNFGEKSVTIGCYGENIHGYGLEGLDVVASGTSMSTFLTTKALALEKAKDSNRSYQQIWDDFEANWLIENQSLLDITQTGKQIDFEYKEAVIEGCTDPGSPNYFVFANSDDGSCTTSIEDNYIDIGFEFYPNPSNGIVNLSFHKNTGMSKKITVYNSLGKIVLKQNSLRDIIQINLQDFSKGIYFIEVSIDDKAITLKLILK